MSAFILYRISGLDAIIMGSYTTLALAEESRDIKIAEYVALQNALRDAAYAAGASSGAVITAEDVLPLVTTQEVVVNA